MIRSREIVVGEDEVVYGEELDHISRRMVRESMPYYGIVE